MKYWKIIEDAPLEYVHPKVKAQDLIESIEGLIKIEPSPEVREIYRDHLKRGLDALEAYRKKLTE